MTNTNHNHYWEIIPFREALCAVSSFTGTKYPNSRKLPNGSKPWVKNTGGYTQPELPFVGGIHWATALNHSSRMFKDLRSKMLEELGRHDFAPKTVQLRWNAYRAYTAADKVPSILEIKHVLANRTILESYLDNCSSLFTNPAQLHVLRSL